MRSSTTYTVADVEELLGLSRREIFGLVDAGFVSASGGARNGLRFSFQDVSVLRTAAQLREAQVPRRQMMRSLKSLQSRLLPGRPMSALRIRAIGREVAVRTGDGWQTADEQQLLLDLDGLPPPGTSTPLQVVPAVDADALVRKALAVEETDPDAAERIYRHALKVDETHPDALMNLGALLCHQGRCHEAVELYEVAVLVVDVAALHFNHAIALEDHGRPAAAAASYERALEIDPEMADAHFNAARLYDKLGDAQRAVRHYSAYRRAQG